MSKHPQYEQLQALIASGQTKKVFNRLRSEKLNAATSQALTVLEASYNDLQQAKIKGTLPYAELQLRKNQINDKLLALLREGLSDAPTTLAGNRLLKIGIPIAAILLLGGLLGWFFLWPSYDCPVFRSSANNKILILPFENVADRPAKPQVSLRNRINQLTEKNNLSTDAQLGQAIADANKNDALAAAKKCSANVVVWGNYSSGQDSFRVVLQYYFLEKPQWDNPGQLVTLKDVTGLQTGTMLKSLDDAIFSLCGVIALREGNNAIAKKWFDKVVGQEPLDKDMLEAIQKKPLIN